MSVTATTKRLYHFDLLRLSLVLLALTSHFMSEQNWEDLMSGSAHKVLLFFTREAMPCLLIIFGFMIEYVYATRWSKQGPHTILERLLVRAILCYAAYVTLAFVAAISGHDSYWNFFISPILLFHFPYANLFKCYALLIPIIFFLMWIRFKYGWKAKILLFFALIAFAEILNYSGFALPKPIAHYGGVFLGLGNNYGPSIIHALILILFGELVANVCLKNMSGKLMALLLIIGLGATFVIGLEIYSVGVKQFVTQIGQYSGYRGQNSPVYFAYGILSFLLFWVLAWGVVKKLSSKLNESITYYGGDTFTIFYFGNMVILFTPRIDNGIIFSGFLLLITLTLALLSVNVLEWATKRFSLINFIDGKIKVAGTALYYVVCWIFGRKYQLKKTAIVNLNPDTKLFTPSSTNTGLSTTDLMEEASVLENAK